MKRRPPVSMNDGSYLVRAASIAVRKFLGVSFTAAPAAWNPTGPPCLIAARITWWQGRHNSLHGSSEPSARTDGWRFVYIDQSRGRYHATSSERSGARPPVRRRRAHHKRSRSSCPLGAAALAIPSLHAAWIHRRRCASDETVSHAARFVAASVAPATPVPGGHGSFEPYPIVISLPDAGHRDPHQ